MKFLAHGVGKHARLNVGPAQMHDVDASATLVNQGVEVLPKTAQTGIAPGQVQLGTLRGRGLRQGTDYSNGKNHRREPNPALSAHRRGGLIPDPAPARGPGPPFGRRLA